jgi:hypothetical protein
MSLPTHNTTRANDITSVDLNLQREDSLDIDIARVQSEVAVDAVVDVNPVIDLSLHREDSLDIDIARVQSEMYTDNDGYDFQKKRLGKVKSKLSKLNGRRPCSARL